MLPLSGSQGRSWPAKTAAVPDNGSIPPCLCIVFTRLPGSGPGRPAASRPPPPPLVIAAVAACGSSAVEHRRRRHRRRRRRRLGASGTLNWEWELPTSWDPVTSSAGLGHARARPRLRVDHHARPQGHGRGRARQLLEVRGRRQERHLPAPPRPEVLRRHRARRATAVKENIVRGQTQANSTVASELSVISKVVVNSPTSFTLDLTQVDYQVPDLLAGKDGMMVSPASFKDVGGSPPSRSARARSR